MELKTQRMHKLERDWDTDIRSLILRLYSRERSWARVAEILNVSRATLMVWNLRLQITLHKEAALGDSE